MLSATEGMGRASTTLHDMQRAPSLLWFGGFLARPLSLR